MTHQATYSATSKILYNLRNMLKLIPLAFSRPKAPREPQVSFRTGAVRDIVSAHSHGNVRLQNGKYYTQQDVDEKYTKLREVIFVD